MPEGLDDNKSRESRDSKPSRREFLAGITGVALNLLTSSIFANMPESPLEKYPDKRKWITLDSLFKAPEKAPEKTPEDIYIFLFELNPRDPTQERNLRNPAHTDDFIAEAGELTGNKIGKHWHVEVVYFNLEHRQWMAIGCRPTECTEDFSLDKLQRQMPGYIVNVQHITVPVKDQEKARKRFGEVLQGQPYNLAGPLETNCTDAALALGKAAGIKDATAIQHATLDELKKSPRTATFLRDWKLSSVEDVLKKRKDIIFPDEFIKIGEYIGSIQF